MTPLNDGTPESIARNIMRKLIEEKGDDMEQLFEAPKVNYSNTVLFHGTIAAPTSTPEPLMARMAASIEESQRQAIEENKGIAHAICHVTILIVTPLTLERAVEVLNKYKHGFGHVAEHETITWTIEPDHDDGKPTRIAALIRYITEYKDSPGDRGERDIRFLFEFEAIAIAEKYLRESE